MNDSAIEENAAVQNDAPETWAAPMEDSNDQMGGTQDLHTGSDANIQQDINLVMDIPVSLTVELGRTKVPIKQILQLAQGSVIELATMAGEPMDVYVNGCLIAQGEVVVVNDKFGIRLTDIVTPAERMRRVAKG